MRKLRWRHREGDEIQAPITYTDGYTIVHRREWVEGRIRPYFNLIDNSVNLVIGRYLTLRKAKQAAEQRTP